MSLGIFWATSASPVSCSPVRYQPGRNCHAYPPTKQATTSSNAVLRPIFSGMLKLFLVIDPLSPYRRHIAIATLSSSIWVQVRAPSIARANVSVRPNAAPLDRVPDIRKPRVHPLRGGVTLVTLPVTSSRRIVSAMKRRSFFRLLWGAPAVVLLRHERDDEMVDESGPLHECVDRPELPCPACTKWTGDPLAIRSNKFFRRTG